MATTYVDITRTELEDWLDSLPWKWNRDPRYSGIYFVHFSDHVGCKLSSTIGSSDQTKGYADASMKLSLVALADGRLLNKKASDRAHFKRTLNWKKTWADGVRHWLQVYQGAASFYDKLAQVPDRESYAKALIARIEKIDAWQSKPVLVDFKQKLESGGILTDKQEGLVSNFEKETGPALSDVQVKFLERLKRLAEKARDANDSFTEGLVASLLQYVRQSKPFSERQKQILKDKLRGYGV